MAERQNKGYDIFTKTLFEQIFRLEEIQEKAIRENDPEIALKASEEIIKAISEIDRHDRELEEDDPLKAWIECDRTVRITPPSPRLLEAAVSIYGFKDIDGQSAVSLIERIYNEERICWARSWKAHESEH